MKVVGAIDQGTSSSRFLLFDVERRRVLAEAQLEVSQSFPKDGWVEMCPKEILSSTISCMRQAMEKFAEEGYDSSVVAGVGVTNQRETTIAWDRRTGEPLYPAIVWLDGRTGPDVEELARESPDGSKEGWKELTGLPLSPYFSALKLRWLLRNVPEFKRAAEEDRLMAGTVDSWLLWNLTGGLNGGVFVTDVTNASRTMLMDINQRAWEPKLCKFFGIPQSCLPSIRSSAEVYGKIDSRLSTGLDGVSIAGCLGDQQSALVGQACLSVGEAKNTYGTGCFLLYNTGTKAVLSKQGLLTTVAYQLGPQAPVHYALEGAVAVGGAAVRWLRDKLGIIKDSREMSRLGAKSSEGVVFVPAFTGLYAPHWDPSARGTILGLSFSSDAASIARATLDAVAWQSREILDGMALDSGLPLASLKVDGGMTVNPLLLQIQSDALNIPVERPEMVETTSLGAAVAAAIGLNLMTPEDFKRQPCALTKFEPLMGEEERETAFRRWKAAVERSKGWTSL